jgi:hypothetical protein
MHKESRLHTGDEPLEHIVHNVRLTSHTVWSPRCADEEWLLE